MGWLWSKTLSSSSTDPLRDLDPSLRDFLSKESPVKYKPSDFEPPSPSTQEPQLHPQSKPDSTTDPESSSPPPVPPESLYQDGRYAHLWSTYTPLSTIENASKSDQEKLQDVLEGYKARKAQIGRAAVENCVFEQMAVDECYTNGGLAAKMTMCRKEGREFERCYAMQSRFLKALGYLSTFERPPEVDERIQMHADTLYHRMLAQEKVVEEAKAAGLPAPEFPPILASQGGAAVSPVQSPNTSCPPVSSSQMTAAKNRKEKEVEELHPLSPETQAVVKPELRQKVRERLKTMTPAEREVEERSIQMEAKTARDIALRMGAVAEGRKKRREEGKGTAADTLAGWFGW